MDCYKLINESTKRNSQLIDLFRLWRVARTVLDVGPRVLVLARVAVDAAVEGVRDFNLFQRGTGNFAANLIANYPWNRQSLI